MGNLTTKKNKKIIDIDYGTPHTNTFELSSDKNEWWVISEGYYKLAIIGADYVIKMGIDQDYLAYPVSFCFRQYIELELKGLTMEIKKLKGEKYKINTNHDLDMALIEFVKEYENYFGSKFDSEISYLIKEFNKIDPNSQKFRYCSKKDGQPIKRNGLHVGFSHLNSVIKKIYDTLNSIESHIDAINDQIQEGYTSVHLP